MMIPDDRVTVVIPTYNRPIFLRWCLSHLMRDNNRFSILVADGSQRDTGDRNAALVDRFSSRLNIRYLGFPGLGIMGRLREIAAQVTTPFLQIHADDDFLFAAGMGAAADALSRVPEAITAQGATMTVQRKDASLIIIPYYYAALLDDSPARRFTAHLRVYWPTFYSTFRTKALARALEVVVAFDSLPSRVQEIALSAAVVLQGKAHFVPCLHGVRTSNPQSHSATDPSWAKIVQDRGFNGVVELFANVIGTELAAGEGCSKRTGRRIAKSVFMEYLANVDLSPHYVAAFMAQARLIHSFFTDQEPAARRQLRYALRNVPYLY